MLNEAPVRREDPAHPLPGPNPGNCASMGELTEYVNRYQREFEEIAAQERLTWNEPSNNLRDLDDMIRYAEQLMNDPSLSTDMRSQLKDALSDMRSWRNKEGDRGVIPSPPIPFRNDRVHQAGQEIDSKVSIKPLR